jgi:hypothetical protein
VSSQSESTQARELTNANIVSGREIVDNTTWAYSVSACFQYCGLNAAVIGLLAAQIEVSYP